jgi:integrase
MCVLILNLYGACTYIEICEGYPSYIFQNFLKWALIGGAIEPYQQQQQQEEENRVYLAYDGLTSSYTKNTYRYAFDNFIKITVKNDNLRVLLETKQSVVEYKIISHIKYLNEVQHLGYLSIQTHLSGILRFFAMNDYHLNIKKIRRFLPEDVADITDRPYSVTEIEKILSKCDGRDGRLRTIVLLMTSTGMRIGGLRELRCGDIRRFDEFGLYLIWVYNRYRKDRYFTFCTPECAAAIDAYLNYRRKFGEEIKDTTPLIREQFDIYDQFAARGAKFVSSRALSLLFEDVLRRSGINQVRPGKEKRDVMTSHGFRKFFINQCERANLNYTTLQLLSGHKLRRVDASYKRTTEEDMLAESVKAIPFLTIDPNQRLKRENEELKKDYLAELGDLRHDFNEMKQLLVHLNKESQKQLVDEFHQKVGDKAGIEWSCDD